MNPKLSLPVLLALAALAGGCVYPARARVVYAAPPAAQAEVIPAAPGPGYYWVRGHWAWRDGRYVWIRGHYIAQRAGGVWVEGHYQNGAGGYFWVEGHWR